jgi:hypothetical protein
MVNLMIKHTSGLMVFLLIWSDNVLEISQLKSTGSFSMAQLIHFGLSP